MKYFSVSYQHIENIGCKSRHKEQPKDLTDAKSKCLRNGDCQHVLQTKGDWPNCPTVFYLCKDEPVIYSFGYCSGAPSVYRKTFEAGM